MLKSPIPAKQIKIRVHWADSAEELTQEVNSNLEAHTEHAIYGMQYQVAMVPGEKGKPQVRHCMVVFFRP